MLEISLLLLTSLAISAPVLKTMLTQKQEKHQRRLELSQYLEEIQKEIEELSTELYLQKRWLKENFIDEVLEIIQSDKVILNYLNRETSPDIFEIHENTQTWIENINYEFIEDELNDHKEYFDNIESNPLTLMQRMAVVTHEENNLILAGAGSGKTSVIIAKVGYILNKGYATQKEILILAFNKKAQQELQERIANKLEVKINIKTFHALGKQIVDKAYGGNTSDFEEMISKATDAIRKKDYFSNYRYIFIDEFQDISKSRNAFILALKKQNSSNITVVGDDWQSINKFAGSDLSIIQNFEHYYGATALIKLDYTFRFNATIAQASQNFILKNPEQIKKNIKTIKASNSQTLYVYRYEHKKNMEQHIEQIVKLIASKTEDEAHKKTIKILSRYSFYEPKNLNVLQQEYADSFDISFNTIHGSKGLEAEHVIITHLESGKFGFPSEKQEEKEPFLHAEERRLFYVAMTRAKEKLFFLTHKKNPSLFMEELVAENEIYFLK